MTDKTKSNTPKTREDNHELTTAKWSARGWVGIVSGTINEIMGRLIGAAVFLIPILHFDIPSWGFAIGRRFGMW